MARIAVDHRRAWKKCAVRVEAVDYDGVSRASGKPYGCNLQRNRSGQSCLG